VLNLARCVVSKDSVNVTLIHHPQEVSEFTDLKLVTSGVGSAWDGT